MYEWQQEQARCLGVRDNSRHSLSADICGGPTARKQIGEHEIYWWKEIYKSVKQWIPSS